MKLKPACSAYFIIATFNNGREHFEPYVRLYRVTGVGWYDDRMTCFKQVGFAIDYNFSFPVNDLNEDVERRNFFR